MLLVVDQAFMCGCILTIQYKRYAVKLCDFYEQDHCIEGGSAPYLHHSYLYFLNVSITLQEHAPTQQSRRNQITKN